MVPSRVASKPNQTALDTVLDSVEAAQLPQKSVKPTSVPSVLHYNQIELADRWRVSPKTLERWRWLRKGPRFIKIGGRVVYRLVDVESFEAQQARG
jgi:hypothetical protein